jgi:hypothetical protein
MHDCEVVYKSQHTIIGQMRGGSIADPWNTSSELDNAAEPEHSLDTRFRVILSSSKS